MYRFDPYSENSNFVEVVSAQPIPESYDYDNIEIDHDQLLAWSCIQGESRFESNPECIWSDDSVSYYRPGCEGFLAYKHNKYVACDSIIRNDDSIVIVSMIHPEHGAIHTTVPLRLFDEENYIEVAGTTYQLLPEDFEEDWCRILKGCNHEESNDMIQQIARCSSIFTAANLVRSELKHTNMNTKTHPNLPPGYLINVKDVIRCGFPGITKDEESKPREQDDKLTEFIVARRKKMSVLRNAWKGHDAAFLPERTAF